MKTINLTALLRQRDKRIAELEAALGVALAAMVRESWQDGPTISEAMVEVHDALHSGDPFAAIDCPVCKTKAKP